MLHTYLHPAADVTERESSGSYTVEIPFFDFRLHVWAMEDQKRFFRRLFSRQTPLVQIIERVLDGHIYRPCFFPKKQRVSTPSPISPSKGTFVMV